MVGLRLLSCLLPQGGKTSVPISFINNEDLMLAYTYPFSDTTRFKEIAIYDDPADEGHVLTHVILDIKEEKS